MIIQLLTAEMEPNFIQTVVSENCGSHAKRKERKIFFDIYYYIYTIKSS